MTSNTPFVFDDVGEAKRYAPATERNRDAIAAVLRDELPASGTLLEIASGSGEHASYFAAAFPGLTWQPSDYDGAGLVSIAAWSAETACTNILPPLKIDAAAAIWPVAHADAILCCNMVHIAPWTAAIGLFAGAGRILPAGAPLILYGPFIEADVETAPSNIAFDESLKARNVEWGVRSTDALDELAHANGLGRARRVAMPANNLVLVWRRI